MSGIIPTIRDFFITTYQTPGAIACGALMGGVAIEAALNVFKNIIELNNSQIRDQQRDAIQYNLGANVGSVLFYGMCFAHVIPGSHFIGAAIFIIYATARCDKEDAYVTTKLVGKPIRWFVQEVMSPVLEAIGNLVSAILRNMFSCQHPIWIGVALLGGAALMYNAVAGIAGAPPARV